MFSAPFFAELLIKALAAAPGIINDVEEIVKQHWGKDHVQQAREGIAAVSKVFEDVAPLADSALNNKKEGT